MRKQTKIHRALYKPLLFVGCERLPFTVITLICGLLIIQIPVLLTFILVSIFYMVAIALVRNINKTDPQFFYCMYRYLFYLADYYTVNGFYSSYKLRPNIFIK
jgi:type IV secretory pathway TrbD component